MTRIRRTLCAFTVLLVLLPLAAIADVAKDLDRIFSESYAADEPGAAVIVIKDGQTVLRKAYGMADLEHGVALAPDMVFRLGSITKQFTAVAILMLAEEGKLKVSDDITQHLPGYPTPGKTITVEHLLTHTSGIPSYTGIAGWIEDKIRLDLSVEEMLDAWDDLELEFDPGSEFRYNNSGYFMLGAIVEAVSGMDYETFVEERIFKTLGMTHSYYGHHAEIIPKRARGYSHDGDGYVNARFLDMGQPYAAGSLLSTVDDLVKWDAALYTDKLLPAAALQRAWTSYKLADGEETGYGYGWAVGNHNGNEVIHHDGGIFGFSTDAIRIPEEKIYVAVLSNGNPMRPNKLTQKAARAMLGEAYENKEIKVDAKELERFVGVYRIDEETTRVVTLEDGQLYTQRNGSGKFAVRPMGDDTFFYEEVPGHARFVSEKGKVTGMEMHRWAAPVERAERTDEPDL
jgi:D-alanyl-D-alanine carboxypeptidase